MIETVEKVQPTLKLNIWRKLNVHVLNGCVVQKEFRVQKTSRIRDFKSMHCTSTQKMHNSILYIKIMKS